MDLLNNFATDIIILAILLLFVVVGAWRGLVKTLSKSCSSLVAIGGALFLHPIVGDLLRKSFIYNAIREFIGKSLGINTVTAVSQPERINVIRTLPLPDSFKTMLLDNNNSVMYELLNANSVTEYITGYIANIFINIIVSILIFILIFIAIKALIGALNLAVNIPVVKQMNSLGGGLLGLVWGVFMIWCFMTIMTLFITTPLFARLMVYIDRSILGSILYDNNIIMNVLLKNLFGGL